MKAPDIAVETGKAVQVLPSFLRSLCRSRFEFDCEELQDEQRTRAAEHLEASPIFNRYVFPSQHVAILRGLDISEFMTLIRKHTIRHEVTFGCSYQRELRKRACWTCPITRSVMQELLKNGSQPDDS